MTLSRTELEQQAIAGCDEAPIHTPGEIQTFGCLLGLDLRCTEFLYWSSNVGDYLRVGADHIGGLAPADVLDGQTLHDLRGLLSRSSTVHQRMLVGTVETKQGPLSAVAHLRGEVVIVEICGEGSIPSRETDDLNRLRWLTQQVPDSDSVNELLTTAVVKLRDFSGYDRVMAYRFRPDRSGEVVAEDRAPTIDSYLGLRFPEFDIPPQARTLYASTPIRMISDVGAGPVVVRSRPDLPPLDMSLAILRASMPVHLQYLANMGVRGSLSLPIVVDGELIGLFAFHHRSPRYLGGRVALAMEFAGHFLNLRIASAIRAERHSIDMEAASICNSLFLSGDNPQTATTAWDVSKRTLPSLIPSDGVVFWSAGGYRTFGDCPPEEHIDAVSAALDPVGDGIAIADDLASRLSHLDLGATGGALRVDVAVDGSVGFLFFRNQVMRTITWAGSPEKTIDLTESVARLSPRGSFDAFLQHIEDRSDGWDQRDIDSAASLRTAASAHLDDDWNTMPESVRLIQELNHRVRNILSLVQSIIRQSRPETKDAREFAEALESRVLALANAHNILTNQGFGSMDLHEAILAESEPYPSERIIVSGNQVGIGAAASPTIILTLHELFSNAAKHGALSGPHGVVQISWLLDEGGLRIVWAEQGGPPVTPPTSTGFGRTLIDQALPHQLGGTTDQAFEPSGVRVTLRLPRSAIEIPEGPTGEDAEQRSEPGGPNVHRILSGTVLIVEDDFLIARQHQLTAERFGASSCLLAGTVDAAMAHIDNHSIDFAILDIKLDHDRSTAIARSLAERGCPFVFITGYDPGDTTLHEFPSVPVARKPIGDVDLAKVIEAAFGRSDKDSI